MRPPNNSRACLSTWWPDQLAGSVLAANAVIALAAGDEAVQGVGVVSVLPTWAGVAWLVLLALAGAGTVAFTELNRPRCTAFALALAGTLLASNAVVVLAPKGLGAMVAASAYAIAAIYSWDRAKEAWAIGRVRRFTDQQLDEAGVL